MPDATLKVVINAPIRPNQPGRGFYQLEEDALFVPIGIYAADRRFFSFIESEHVRLDCDKAGELLFIEITLARKQWQIDGALVPPKHAATADLRWLDFRAQMPNPAVLTDKKHSLVCIKFSDAKPATAYQMAEAVIAEVTKELRVCRIWITEIIDDVAGKEISAFRRQQSAS
ncbi:MAG: hypothetical protein HY851_03400 [candidate division Zixibacteria bacterium]|nr:hypothetical protein [candidate division Zixibacteria bacterium]